MRARERRHERRTNTPRRRCVVFFGDGFFGHHRGHASVPKKSVVRELGIRTPTLLIDEYLTSKTCLCGRRLQDAETARRVRVPTQTAGATVQRFSVASVIVTSWLP